jgi:hypothetical protein
LLVATSSLDGCCSCFLLVLHSSLCVCFFTSRGFGGFCLKLLWRRLKLLSGLLWRMLRLAKRALHVMLLLVRWWCRARPVARLQREHPTAHAAHAAATPVRADWHRGMRVLQLLVLWQRCATAVLLLPRMLKLPTHAGWG